MEVSRFEPPKNNFLKKVRKLANKFNIILILMNARLVLEKLMEDYINIIMSSPT